MKPPLTVEAKVAEELRNWLASELEQLDASNTNQFAHHVVTILLNEDLDIEDEPLTTGDDFLKDIDSIKQGKTRDKQKKAAVQFLRNAVCCDNNPGEVVIQDVVEELMVKIDETKNKMNSKKASKRSLLAPIAINIKTSSNQPCLKSDGNEDERRYNEAFPSLSGEESPIKEGVPHANSNNNSVWNRSPSDGKENCKKKFKRKQQQTPKAMFAFTCHEEAQACNIARQAAALVLAERSLPKAEAAEVSSATPLNSSSSSLIDPGCWKSAFRTLSLTDVFCPRTAPLRPASSFSHVLVSKTFPAFKVSGSDGINTDNSDPLLSYLQSDSLSSSTVFLPIREKQTKLEREKFKYLGTKPFSDTDLEVCNIIRQGKERENRLKARLEKLHSEHQKLYTHEECIDYFTTEIEEVQSFPNHYGEFFENLVLYGVVSQYPDFSAPVEAENCMENITWSGGVFSRLADLGVESLVSFCHRVFVDVDESGSVSELIASSDNNPMAGTPMNDYGCDEEKCQDQKLLTDLGITVEPNDLRESQGVNESLKAVHLNYEVEADINMNLDPNYVFKTEQGVTLGKDGKEDKQVVNEIEFGSHTDMLSSSVNYHHSLPSFLYNIGMGYSFEDYVGRFVKQVNMNSFQQVSCSVVQYRNECSEPNGSRSIGHMFERCIEDEQFIPSAERLLDKFLTLPSFDAYIVRPPVTDFDYVSNSTMDRSYLSKQVEQHGPGPELSSNHYNEHQIPQLPSSTLSNSYIDQDLLATLMTGIVSEHSNPPNPYMPSLLTECLSNKEGQFLQSALVNTYFYNLGQQEAKVNLEAGPENSISAIDCSDLEKVWLSEGAHQAYGLASAQYEVRGQTCSNWLEQNCQLGLSCPYSHPSI